jgi:carboxypeptidase Q
MSHPFRKILLMISVGALLPFVIRAQEPPPAAKGAKPAEKEASKTEAKAETPKPKADAIERIKEEGLKRSQVMATLSYLTDVIGPRLTGSPNLKRANDWTRDTLAKWGLSNAHLEPWGPFGLVLLHKSQLVMK